MMQINEKAWLLGVLNSYVYGNNPYEAALLGGLADSRVMKSTFDEFKGGLFLPPSLVRSLARLASLPSHISCASSERATACADGRGRMDGWMDGWMARHQTE